MRQALAILRMVIGGGFIFLGVTSLLDERLLYGGLMERLQEFGNSFGLYRRFVLTPYAEIHEEGFVITLSIIAILVGLLLLLGVFVSWASVLGAGLIANFALATTGGHWGFFALYIGLAFSLLLIGRVGGGLTWGLDSKLIQRLPPMMVLFPLRRTVPD